MFLQELLDTSYNLLYGAEVDDILFHTNKMLWERAELKRIARNVYYMNMNDIFANNTYAAHANTWMLGVFKNQDKMELVQEKVNHESHFLYDNSFSCLHLNNICTTTLTARYK